MKELVEALFLLKQYPMAARLVVWACFIIATGVLVFVPRTFAPKKDSNPIRYVSIDPNTHKTQIYPRTKALVDQRREHLINEKVDPWLMIHTGKMRPIKLHDGRTCQYTGDGISYAGPPALVFWEALIDPFLEDEIRHVLDSVGNECIENKIDAEIPLDEAAMLLRGMVESVYDRMVYVDQRLCTKPTQKEKAPRRDIQSEVDKLVRYVDEQEMAAKALFSRKEM